MNICDIKFRVRARILICVKRSRHLLLLNGPSILFCVFCDTLCKYVIGHFFYGRGAEPWLIYAEAQMNHGQISALKKNAHVKNMNCLCYIVCVVFLLTC